MYRSLVYVIGVASFLSEHLFTPLLAFIDIFCLTKVDIILTVHYPFYRHSCCKL